MTHISYECAKKLKDFLKESAPEPIGGQYYGEFATPTSKYLGKTEVPVYMLHDLLSKPFCEAFLNKVWDIDLRRKPDEYIDLAVDISKQYFYDGLPAVEAKLMKMMEEK